jgi:hypothetical protein
MYYNSFTELYGVTTITNSHYGAMYHRRSMLNRFIGTRRTERKALTIYRVSKKCLASNL